jgi:hypothetical protein
VGVDQFHRDLPAHREAADHRAVDAFPVEQGDQVGGELRQRHGAFRHRARAVTAQVGGQHPPALGGEVVDLRPPHRPVERVAVNEENRGHRE